jgi:hypothetical protein
LRTRLLLLMLAACRTYHINGEKGRHYLHCWLYYVRCNVYYLIGRAARDAVRLLAAGPQLQHSSAVVKIIQKSSTVLNLFYRLKAYFCMRVAS